MFETQPVSAKAKGNSNAKLMAEVERLKAENEALRQRQPGPRKVSMKVSEKGAASMYGIRRFPVTFYREEWERILSYADDIRAFLEAHKGQLSVKGSE